MNQVRFLPPVILFALGVTAGASAKPAITDPLAALVCRVVGAIGRDDLAAFDPLVARDRPFNWEASLSPLVARYQCPVVEKWAYTVLESTGTSARVRLEITGSAELAGRRTPVQLPRFWVLELQRVDDRWYMASFARLERDIARRIACAPLEERQALITADPDADTPTVIRELADFATTELLLNVHYLFPSASNYWEVAHDLAWLALDEARRSGDPVLEAVVLGRFAATLRAAGQRSESLTLAEHAVDVAERSGDPDALASAYFARGLGRWVNGDAPSAVKDLQASARLVYEVNDVLIPLHGRSMLTNVAISHHDYRTTILRSEELAAESRSVGWVEGESNATWALGDVHYALHDFVVAREMYASAYELARRAHELVAPGALVDMARCDLALGHPALAAQEIRDSGWLRNKGGARLRADFGSVLIAAKKFGEAERVLNLAIANAEVESDGQAACDAYTALAQLRLIQHRPAAALAAGREALRRGLDGTTPLTDWSPWHAEAVMAQALRALGRQREARNALQDAVTLIEQLRTTMASDPSATRYFEDKTGVYDDLLEANLALGDVRGALVVAERLRARTLRDSFFQMDLDRNALLTAEEHSREESAEKRLEGLNRRILAAGKAAGLPLRQERERARLALDRTLDELTLAHPELHVRRADFQPSLSLPSSLAGTALVEYAVAADATYIFTVLRNEGKPAIRVRRAEVTRAELSQLIDRLATQIAQRDLRYRRIASRLYQLLVAPVAGEILVKQAVCIVPDDVLWALPFQLLIDPAGIDLITKRPLFYSPSLTLLTLAPARHRSQERMLVAFANPSAGGTAISQVHAQLDTNFGALPDAETEARSIASIYGSGQSRVFLGSSARESTFKRVAPSARIIHIATHGVIDDRAPLYSALLFAPDSLGGDDGLLEAREVLDLHLDADLAVLSACDTARGKIGAGEGVIGLSWAFLVAGCRTLVVSQAPAETAATSTLMIEFYRQLRSGASPAAALRRAQLALRREPRFSQPFYWAPFIVIGHGFAPSSP